MEPTKEQAIKLKNIELDIFIKFIEVCEKLNIKYYVLGGTLLGAVRHSGFIPWDDDIDVGMLREDYEKFITQGQALLPENLFIQNLYSDPEFSANFSKIRNCDTTFIETSLKNCKINHGIYIDIFPLDYMPEDTKKRNAIYKYNKLMARRIATVFYIPNDKHKVRHSLINFIMKIFFPSHRKTLLRREDLIKSVKNGSFLCNYCGAWGVKEIIPTEWYGKGTVLEFEGIKVIAPTEYSKWLTQVYGDYMQLPPIEKRVGHHYTEVIDTDKSYTKYMNMESKI